MKEAAVQGKSAVALGPSILPVASSWGRAQPHCPAWAPEAEQVVQKYKT